MNKVLVIGSFLGFTSVAIAAYVDHSLALHLNDKQTSSMLMAVRYQQIYAILICVIGLHIPRQVNLRVSAWLQRAAYLFIAGILLFSFGIYIATILNAHSLLHFVPIGGMMLMAGWGGLLRAAFIK